MTNKKILKEIDPGTGLTLEDLIDAFISDPREAKRIKDHLTQSKPEQEDHPTMAVKWT